MSESFLAGIKHWLHYRPNIGVDGLHIIGLPGSGKSNMANGLVLQCMEKKDERLVIPGDRFCEWRNIIHHPIWIRNGFKYKVIIPDKENLILYPDPFPIADKMFDIVEDYSTIDIKEYLDEYHLLIIYDQHYYPDTRTALWSDILQQLVNRDYLLEQAIILLFHEAGNYFPETAIGQQWEDIRNYSNLFVETRKGLVRNMFLSQIKTELKYTLREKCAFKIFRQCWPGKREHPAIISQAPFLPINEYIICRGGLFKLDNTIKKQFEEKNIFKIIPRHYINQGGGSLVVVGKSPKFPKKKCFSCEYNYFPSVEFPVKCPRCSKRFEYEEETVA